FTAGSSEDPSEPPAEPTRRRFRALIGPAQLAWVSTGAPGGTSAAPKMRHAAEEAVASRFISRGIVGRARGPRQALSSRQARQWASPHSHGASYGLLGVQKPRRSRVAKDLSV